jgi:hypothetical protein
MIDLGAIPNELGAVSGFFGTKAVAIAARVIKQRVLHLTSQGLDYNGIPFPMVSSYGRPLSAYSHSYERTRKNYGLQIAKRDLRFTGVMLDSMLLITHEDGGILTFPDDQLKIAEYQIMRGDNFMDVSEETLEMATLEIDSELQAELNGWISNE